MTKARAMEIMESQATFLKKMGEDKLVAIDTLYNFVLAWSLAEIIDNDQFIGLNHMVGDLVNEVYGGDYD